MSTAWMIPPSRYTHPTTSTDPIHRRRGDAHNAVVLGVWRDNGQSVNSESANGANVASLIAVRTLNVTLTMAWQLASSRLRP